MPQGCAAGWPRERQLLYFAAARFAREFSTPTMHDIPFFVGVLAHVCFSVSRTESFLFVILFYISLHFIHLGGETYQCRELRSLLIVWRRGRLVAMSGQLAMAGRHLVVSGRQLAVSGQLAVRWRTSKQRCQSSGRLRSCSRTSCHRTLPLAILGHGD